jgi:UrcA family protein
MSKWIVVAVVLGGILVMQGRAAAAEVATAQVRMRYERGELTSPTAAHHLLRRIGEAALESCGASFSLAEFKTATVASPCWRDAVDEAVRRIDNPLLTAAAQESRRPENR